MKKLLAALLLVGMFFTVVHAQEDELLTVEAVKQFKYEFWQNHKDDYDTMLEQAKKAGEIFTASEGYRTLKRFEQENDPNIAPLTQEELEDLYQTGVITLDALDHVIASVNEEEKAFLDKLLAYSIERKLLKPMTLEKFIQKYVIIIEKYAMDNEFSEEEMENYKACAKYMPFIMYKVKRQKEREKALREYYEVFLHTPQEDALAQSAA